MRDRGGGDRQPQQARKVRCASRCQAKLETESQKPEAQRSPPIWGLRVGGNPQVMPLADFCFCDPEKFEKATFQEVVHSFIHSCIYALLSIKYNLIYIGHDLPQ